MADTPKAPSKLSKEELGEGNRSADRRYRAGLAEFQKRDDPEKRAREALADLERDPEAYRKAEEEGKRHLAEEDPEVSGDDTEVEQ